jgi:predicted transcriptional regulator
MKMNGTTVLQNMETELGYIRKLLVLALSRAGASQDDIAEALGVSQSSISRMSSKPKKAVKRKAKRPHSKRR